MAYLEVTGVSDALQRNIGDSILCVNCKNTLVEDGTLGCVTNNLMYLIEKSGDGNKYNRYICKKCATQADGWTFVDDSVTPEETVIQHTEEMEEDSISTDVGTLLQWICTGLQ